MSEPATGLLFVPIPPDVPDWKANLVERIFDNLERISHTPIKEVRAPEDLSHRQLTRERLIKRVATNRAEGRIVCENFAGFWLTLWLFQARSQVAYQQINLDVAAHSFAEIQGDPMKVEAFSAAWVDLCESLGAEAAYFSESHYTDPDLLTDEGLDFLQREDFQGFLNGGWWRTYLHPQGKVNWQEKLEFGLKASIEECSSGAFLIADGRGYNPQLGDWDTLLNVHFLREQIRKRTEIPGARSLLDMLQLEERHLRRIEDDKDYVKYGDAAFYDYESLHEARLLLDAIRATWVCALRCSGLIGVYQPFSGAVGQPEVLVPVVAEEGRKWILATLLSPFDLASSQWSNPETGFHKRIQQLLEAAPQNFRDSNPPHVEVYFWRGVSPEFHEALNTMGVRVEISAQLPLLE